MRKYQYKNVSKVREHNAWKNASHHVYENHFTERRFNLKLISLAQFVISISHTPTTPQEESSVQWILHPIANPICFKKLTCCSSFDLVHRNKQKNNNDIKTKIHVQHTSLYISEMITMNLSSEGSFNWKT